MSKNINHQLNNIIKNLARVVGGGTNIIYTSTNIYQKIDFIDWQADRLKFYVAHNLTTTTTTTTSTTTTTTTTI